MRIQVDYETDFTLAVFYFADQARRAAGELRAAGVATSAMRITPLAAGRYQTIDPQLGEEFGGALRGAVVGASAGVVLGLGMALAIGTSSLNVFAAAGAAGILAGALVGSLVGAEVRARYNDDIAQQIYVSPQSSALLLLTATPNGVTRRARQALRRAGAVGFLDPSTYPAEELESTALHLRTNGFTRVR